MFAISNKAGKFINVEYFLDPEKLFNITVSAKPRSIKSKEIAIKAVVHLDEYLTERIAFMSNLIATRTKELKSTYTSLKNANTALSELKSQPYDEVHQQMAKKLKQVNSFESKIHILEDNIKSFTKNLTRFETIKQQGYELVEVKQTISCSPVTV